MSKKPILKYYPNGKIDSALNQLDEQGFEVVEKTSAVKLDSFEFQKHLLNVIFQILLVLASVFVSLSIAYQGELSILQGAEEPFYESLRRITYLPGGRYSTPLPSFESYSDLEVDCQTKMARFNDKNWAIPQECGLTGYQNDFNAKYDFERSFKTLVFVNYYYLNDFSPKTNGRALELETVCENQRDANANSQITLETCSDAKQLRENTQIVTNQYEETVSAYSSSLRARIKKSLYLDYINWFAWNTLAAMFLYGVFWAAVNSMLRKKD